MRYFFWVLVVLSSCFSTAQADRASNEGSNRLAMDSWFDRSHEALLPAQVANHLASYRDFPVFWWNFIVVEFPSDQAVPWGSLKKNCRDRLEKVKSLIQQSPCDGMTSALQETLSDWSRDFILRHPRPSTPDLEKMYAGTLAKASLPIDTAMVQVLRKDPFNSLEEYKQLMLSRNGLHFENHQGLFHEPQTNRVLIPIQMTASPGHLPANLEDLQSAMDTLCADLGCRKLGIIGPHISAWENETRIRTDVDIVSYVGWVVLFLFALFFLISGKWKLLLLVPPLFIAMILAAAFTYLIFGKIHGLTLAFGPGIVGLAIDYGLHAALVTPTAKGIWRANFFGLLTTVAVFAVVLLSDLPILRQLGTFSLFGLLISFVLFYAFQAFFPRLFYVTSYNWYMPGHWPLVALALTFIVFGLCSSLFLRPDLSLQKFNYEAPQNQELRNWLYSAGQMKPPLLLIQRGTFSEVLPQSHETAQWLQKQKIDFESLARYLPKQDVQEANRLSWRQEICHTKGTTALARDFFAPFWNQFKCDDKRGPTLRGSHVFPAYLKNLTAQGTWVSLLFPQDASARANIQEKFPDAIDMSEIVSLFSHTLSRELKWMVPLALLLSFAFLYLHNRSFKNSVLSVVPFVAGLGCFSLSLLIFKLDVSFITLIGLIMVFGFSLDYGIFVVNLIKSQQDQRRTGVWMALTLSSVTTILGFVPLVFAWHPALRHLGQSLLAGSIGTYVGSVWGIPVISAWLEQWNTKCKTK